MKNKIIKFVIFNMIFIIHELSLFGTSIHYPRLRTEKPGYHAENSSNRQNTNGIPFTATEMSSTNTNNNSNNEDGIGYFWDSKDRDNTLLYPGKARIGNDQYINAVAVDSKNIIGNNDPNATIRISDANIMNQNQENNNKFNPGNLIKLGTFMKKKMIR